MELRKVVQVIREEFEDTPGLRLTVPEASRFWGLDEGVCELVFAQLMATGVLAEGSDNRYQLYFRA